MKTNRELNTAHDAKMAERMRPKQPEYNWEPLAAVIAQWKASAENSCSKQ